MHEAMQCINNLQETSFRINQPVLEVLDHIWRNNIPVHGLTSRENIEQVPYPFDTQPKELNKQQEKEFKLWVRKRAATFKANAKTMSKRLQIERTIQIAKNDLDLEKFWYVWQFDFRGRAYPKSDFLHPQSADYGRALIEFTKGIAINQEEDARWLAIHGANCFGEDKISLDEREDWAYDHEEDIVKTAENPFDYTWWMTADKPFSALAWCFEFYGYLKEGMGYVTTLPVSAEQVTSGELNSVNSFTPVLGQCVF